MAKQRTYLKEWRKHRGYRQEDVIARLEVFEDENIPRTAASLSRIENGKQIYTQRILEALADIYGVDEPGWLLSRNPLKQGDVIDLLAEMDDRDQARAKTIIEALKRSGTEG